jgi:hypothetical protein
MSQKEHVATRFHARYQNLAKGRIPFGSSSVLLESRCGFGPEGFLAGRNSQKCSKNENPDATWQTRAPLLESKLLKQNCC